MKLELISANPGILGGKPCITGTRLSVEFILELVASGASIPEIVATYPQLTPQAVQEAILYAVQATRNEIIVEVKAA